MGELDLIKPILEGRGQVHFGRVNLKPGKPLTFATVDHKPVFALPGFPVSSLVSFEVFVRPALRQMSGQRLILRPHVPVTQAEPFNAGETVTAILLEHPETEPYPPSWGAPQV